MKCPYCYKEMVKGYIYGYRYSLKWMPENKNLLFGVWAKGCIELGNDEEPGRPKVEAYMCSECSKWFIDTAVESSE